MQLLNILKNNKKVILIISSVMLIFICMPIITTIIDVIFNLGQQLGTNIRGIIEGNIC